MRGKNLENAALLAAHDLETAQQKVKALESDIEQARIDPYTRETRVKDQMEEISRMLATIKEHDKTSAGLVEARHTPKKSDEIQPLMKEQSALWVELEKQITKTIQGYKNTDPKPAMIEFLMKEQQSGGAVIKDFEGVLKWENDKLTKQLSAVEKDKLVWPKAANERSGFVSPTIVKLEVELEAAKEQVALAQQVKEDVALITAVTRVPEVAPDGQSLTVEEIAQLAKDVRGAAERAKQNEGVKAIATDAADKADKTVMERATKFKQEHTFLEKMHQERQAELGKLKIADKSEKVNILDEHFKDRAVFEKMRQERQAELNELRTADKGEKVREKVGVLDKQLGKHFKDRMVADVHQLVLGQVVRSLGSYGRGFCEDQTKGRDGTTALEDARSLVMKVMLEEIGTKTGKPLIKHTTYEEYSEKLRRNVTKTKETILLDPQDIRKIEKLVDKAIVQTVKELNEHIDTTDRISNPGRNRKEELDDTTYIVI